MQKKILLTGATGFIGQALTNHLIALGYDIVISVRSFNKDIPPYIMQVETGDFLASINWEEHLAGVDIVIHLAARVHIMNDIAADPYQAFRETNTIATKRFADQAAQAGVSRFIFLSSIKVNGEYTLQGSPFFANDVFTPIDPYARSKYEAEQNLIDISSSTPMEVVIIRPPLVYGPHVKANFLSMVSWVNKGIPLPLGAIQNQRSLLALDNLVDLIKICINHPAAGNKTFLVSDDEDLSTTELLQRIAIALGKPSRLLSIPPNVLTLGATLLGKRDVAQRLFGSLQVDIEHTKNTLNWKPPISVDVALQKTADSYLQLKKKRVFP